MARRPALAKSTSPAARSALAALGGSARVAPTGSNTVSIGTSGTIAGVDGDTLTLTNGLTLMTNPSPGSSSIARFTLSSPNTTPMINVSGGTLSVTGGGTNTINLTGTLNSVGTYELYSVSSGMISASSFTVGTSPPQAYLYQLQAAGGGSQRDLIVELLNLTWTDNSGSHGWDATTPNNWAEGSSNQTYADGAEVTFNDMNATGGSPPSGTVIVQSGGVAPVSVTFNNSSVGYVLSNAGGDPNGIRGTTPVVIQGGGTVTFSSPNTYHGATTLSNNSTLVLGDPNAVQNSTVTVGSGSTLQFASGLLTETANLGGLAGSGNIALTDLGNNAVALNVVGFNSANTTYSGNLSGLGSLTLSGGTLALGGTNSYAGTTTINGGTLSIAAASALGAPASSNAILTLNGGTLRATGSLALTSAGAGTPNFAVSLGSSGGAINVTSSSNTLTVPGAIGGNGALTLTGPGTVLLQGSNNYSGQTNVNAGTLRVDGSIANSTTNVNGSTTVLTGAGTTGAVNVTNGTVAPGDNGSGTLTTANLSLAAGTSLNYTLTSPGGSSPLSSAALTLPTSGSPVNVNINNTAAAAVRHLSADQLLKPVRRIQSVQ